MKITLPYLRRVILWSLIIMTIVTVVFALTVAMGNALLWVAGGLGTLFWVLYAAALLVFLVLVRLGMDLALDITIKKQQSKK